MNKEQDLKKIVAVIVVLIVAIAVFIGIRSLQKKDEPTPVPTPTATATPTPDPTATPTPKPTVKPSTDTGTETPKGEDMGNVVERPTPTPAPTPTPVPELSREDFEKIVRNADEIIKHPEIGGSNDPNFITLLAELIVLIDEGDDMLADSNLTSAKMFEHANLIANKLVEIKDRLGLLMEDAEAKVLKAEQSITLENVDAAIKAVGFLPNDEFKEALKSRLDLIVPTIIAHISTLEELKVALANSTIKRIELDSNISNVDVTLNALTTVEINGNDYSLTFANSVKQGLVIHGNDSVVNDLKIVMADINGWNSSYALHVYNATGVVINNYTGTGADAGLLVNASTVKLTGTTTVTGNEFGGIEVSKGTVTDLPNSKLNVTGTIVYDEEELAKPTIWLVNGEGTVTAPAYTASKEIKAGQTQYYKDGTIVTTKNVKNETELVASLANSEIKIINLSQDINDISTTLNAVNKVTINGNGHSLTFANTVKQGLVIHGNNSVVNDLKIVMAGINGWNSSYALHVYNATGVVINNYTGTGADAGLLVNASTVKLTGTTTVTGNEFGGIEVSKGTEAGLRNSVLNVTGVIVNQTESVTEPTIWLENGEGTINASSMREELNPTKPNQTFYFNS